MIFPSYDLLVADIHQAMEKNDLERLKSLYPFLEDEKTADMPELVYARHLELIEEVKKMVHPSEPIRTNQS